MAFNLNPEPFRFAPYCEELEAELCRAPRQKIEALQSERIRHVVGYAKQNIPFYQKLWRGIDVDQIRTIADLAKLPTWNVDTQRKDIEACPPYGSNYTPAVRDDIAFMLSTSGTTGSPRLAPVARQDIPGMRDIMARCYKQFGLGNKDLLQITFTYATMGAAWAFTWAAEGAGVGVLPTSSGRTTESVKQVDLMRRSGVTAIVGTASFLLRLAEVAIQQGHDPSTWPVHTVITAGELSSVGARQKLEKLWGAKVYDLFGSFDTMTWSSIDCDASRTVHGELGMHIWEDACLIEVLDPEGNPVPDGEYGEMCVTSWVWKTSPKIRFRSGDMVAVRREPCSCGRTLARMMPVKGRVDHVIRIRATNIHPMSIESAILAASPASTEWLAEAINAADGDRISITIESENPEDAADRAKLESSIRSKLSLSVVDVRLVPPRATAEATGSGRDPKVRRVFDRRTNDAVRAAV